MFNDGVISWSRIITFLTFSAMLAEHIIRQQTDGLSSNLIISSLVDWTTNFIDTDLHSWLESQNYWVKFFLLLVKNKLVYFSKGRLFESS